MDTEKRNGISVFGDINSISGIPSFLGRDAISTRPFGHDLIQKGMMNHPFNFPDYTSHVRQSFLLETAKYRNALDTLTGRTHLDFARQNFVPSTAFSVPISDRIEVFRRRTSGLLFAAEHGWFIPQNLPMSEIAKIGRYAEDHDTKSLDIMMQEFTRLHLQEITDNLISSYPERAHIFREAFSLHKEGRYVAAIPLFLSQAEGIGQSKSNRSLFNVRSGNRTQISDYLDKTFTADIISMFVAPLKTKHPLTQTGVKRLSRHKVLHGVDIDYGTEFNSLQAISFLGNVGWLLSMDINYSSSKKCLGQ